VVELGKGVTRVRTGDRVAAGEATLRCLPVLPQRAGPPLPQGTDHWLPAPRMLRRARPAPRDRSGARR
jgi:hypothetical protein